MKIIITAPSINVLNNVSGIAAHTRLLIDSNVFVKYVHFIVGKRDHQKRNFTLILYQLFFIFQFVSLLFKNRDCRIVHINIPLEKFSIIKNFVLFIISKVFSKRVIIHLRGGVYSNSTEIPYLYLFFLRFMFWLANHIITLGERERVLLMKQNKLSARKVTPLPNMTYFPKVLQKKSNNQINIIFHGRIDKNKGLDVLFESLVLLKNRKHFKFYVAGTGPYAEYFLSRCKNELSNCFQYLGVINSVEKHQILKECHFFILPSMYEGLPNAMLESMAYGLVPLVTSVGSIPEVIQNDFNGFFIDGKSPLEIATIICNLSNNRELLNTISQNARNTISENFNIDNYVSKINHIYSLV
jgi:glycosyltransferase involved in cell wall biosynthesis